MADWTLTLIEREDGKYTFDLIDNVNSVTHSPQQSYINRDVAIDAAAAMRDRLTGADTRSSNSFDFDPV